MVANGCQAVTAPPSFPIIRKACPSKYASNERIGDIEQNLMHPDEARAAFERALAIYEALLRTNPENTYFLVSSTVPLVRLGDLDPNRQTAYFERALKILKDLDATGRLEPRRKGLIARLESRLGQR
jgi:hypothetical protein